MAIVVRWFSMSFGPRLKPDRLTATLCSVLYLLIGIWYWNGSGFHGASCWLVSSSASSARTVDVLPSDHTTSTFGCCCCCCCWPGNGKPAVVPLIHDPVTPVTAYLHQCPEFALFYLFVCTVTIMYIRWSNDSWHHEQIGLPVHYNHNPLSKISDVEIRYH